MIEIGCGALGDWAWTFISHTGRVLAYDKGFRTAGDALAAARHYRALWWRCGDQIDHRMGACR